jgi:predicted SprT family Zn-dependent metalloprotease
MTENAMRVRREIDATIERAGFEALESAAIGIDVTDSFRCRHGECRRRSSGAPDAGDTVEYEIRIASRLFEDGREDRWRDTVRHEVAHAYVLETVGPDARPHGETWKTAARRAGADPVARYEGEDTIDAEYVLACPEGCFEREYVQRSMRVKQPWQSTCAECGARPVSYDVGERPADPDPGTCYVQTIPWRTPEDRDEPDDAKNPARYLLACPNGCTAWPYQRSSKRIKNPWLYACPECDTKLLSCDLDANPTDLEPGQCHVRSVPWQEPRVVHACPNGCFTAGYGQHTEQTRQPQRYRCEECGTRTVAYPSDQRPETLDPGTNHLE